jgi:hypothetical protein
MRKSGPLAGLTAALAAAAGLILVPGCNAGEPANGDAIKQELVKQKTEIPECERRLAALYRAWSDYQKDHKGAEPSSVASLYPKYISDPAKLICPTAQRWIDSKRAIGHGEATFDGKKYTTTYGFLWLTSGAARAKRKLGDEAPLVLCQAHSEALYMAAYNKVLHPGALSEEKRQTLAPEVANSKDIAVLRNGKTVHVSPDSY